MVKTLERRVLGLRFNGVDSLLNILYGVVVLSSLGFLTYNILHARNIKRNLEPQAIYCGFKSNVTWTFKSSLPLSKNVDLDGNGKYEAVFIYMDQEENKVYQEIIRRRDGTFIFGEPKLYK